MKQIIIAAALLLSTSAFAGLTGTELSLRTLAQATPSSTPFITSFERTVVVGSAVEYPDVASLFNPATGEIRAGQPQQPIRNPGIVIGAR